LAQICTKLFVGLGFVPDPTRELPRPLAGLGVGPPGKGKENGEEEREGREGRE